MAPGPAESGDSLAIASAVESPPAAVATADVEAAVRADVDAHGAELFHVIRRSLDDEVLAREVLQDVFVRAWRADDHYDPARASRRAWLFAIARSVTMDVVRSRRRRPSAGAESADVDRVVEAAAGSAADRLALEAAMRTLSDEHRRALIEVHVHGRSYDEVASEYDLPVGTVRSRVSYALRKLRDTMVDQGWHHD